MTSEVLEIHGGLVARLRPDFLQMHAPDQTNSRTDHHLHTADEEQPGGRERGRFGEEEHRTDDEPYGDDDVVADAHDLVTLPDDELLAPDLDVQRMIMSWRCHSLIVAKLEQADNETDRGGQDAGAE